MDIQKYILLAFVICLCGCECNDPIIYTSDDTVQLSERVAKKEVLDSSELAQAQRLGHY